MSSTGTRKERNVQTRSSEAITEADKQFIEGFKVFGESSNSTSGLTGPSVNNSPKTAAGNYLAREGDSIIGPLALGPPLDFTIEVDVNNTIDIGPLNDNPQYTSNVQLDSLQTNSSVLDIIANAAFDGQLLVLRTFAPTIPYTISQGTLGNGGNIQTGDGNDLSVGDLQTVTLIFDESLKIEVNIGGSWRVLSVSSGGGGSGLTEPIILTVNTITPETLPTTSIVDWSKNPNHITLDRDVEFSFSNLPASGSYEGVLVIIDVDATGGYAAPVWPASVTNPPTVPTTALTRTSVMLYTIDGGTTVTHATSVGSSAGGGANTSLSNLITTSINEDLIPDGDNTRDLGETGAEWAQLWVTTITNNATVAVTSPTFSVTSATINLGDAITDEVNFLGRVGSLGVLPISTSDTNLGASANQWNTLWIDILQNNTTVAVQSPNFAINSSQITFGDAITDDISFLGQVDTNIVIEEISLPASAPANTGRFYARDVGAVSVPFWIDEAGTESSMIAGGILLSANNTWTGIQTFTGTTFNVNTTAINLGDAITDSINFLGRVGSLGLIPLAGSTDLGASGNEWASLYVDTIPSTVTFTGATVNVNSATINLGDAVTDTINFLGQVGNLGIIPINDDAADLGGVGEEWKDLYIDGTAFIDTADIGIISSSVTFTGSTVNFNSATINLGDATTDDINFLGRIDTDFVPSTDNASDLGSAALEWKDLFIDGIADIDRLENNGAAIAVGDDLDFDFGDTVDFNAGQSTVGSAGGASAPPATPTGYIIIKKAGVEVVVPFYDKV